MKKKILIPIIVVIVIIGILLLIYPTIEIQTDDKLIAFRYTDDTIEFESEISYNESYVYYEDRDISIKDFDFKRFLFFHIITMEYIEGNYCDTQFVLEEAYIEEFLERAEIKYNDSNLDIAKLIEGREAIVGNTRYLGNDYDKVIYYVLDGKHEELYVFYVDDLLIIQVGSPDESPKFIAYTEQETVKQETVIEPQTYSLLEIQNMEAETVLDETRLNQELIDNLFYSVQISEEIKDRIWNVSYKENDNISLEELRYLRVLYRGFDGETHIGELIVNQSIAEDILEIMFELYRNDYPIEKMVLVDEYNGDDEASMEDNNTSAFNYRVIAGSNNLSKHGFGLAIDINPKYNPYVVERADGEIVVSPENGVDYVERSKDFSYKLSEDDLCVRLFLEHGFTWGGNWNSLKDYQHFEK